MLGTEHRLAVFEKGVLKLCRAKSEDVTGGWRKCITMNLIL
jgi:hypothetical protein